MYNTIENAIPKTGLFATPISFESLMQYCELFNGQERVIAITVGTMALNLAHKTVEEEILSKDIFA